MGISTEKKIRMDVELVRKEATGLIELKKEMPPKMRYNPDGRLSVIAVVGKPTVPNPNLPRNRKRKIEEETADIEEALLFEVGVGRNPPYNGAWGKPHGKWLPGRRKWFRLTEDQYQEVAPFAFHFVEAMAQERVSKWAKGPCGDDPFCLLVPHTRYLRRHGKTFAGLKLQEKLAGARFKVSLQDEFAVRDIYWADTVLNNHFRGSLLGLGRFIDLRIGMIGVNRCSGERFFSLKGVKDAVEALRVRGLAPYQVKLLEELEYKGTRVIRHPRFWEIAELFGADGQPLPELVLARSALAKPQDRLGNIQLRVTTGLDALKPFITFEVFPDIPKKDNREFP